MNPVYICIPTTKERRPRLAKCVESIHQFAGHPHVICAYENEREGFVGPIHKILSGLRDDALVWCIGDDSILFEPNTLGQLMTSYGLCIGCATPQIGVVQPDDGIQHGRIATMPLCTAETMRTFTHKGYFLNFADNEFTERLHGIGKYFYDPAAKVDHQHHVVGKAELDQTYQVGNEKWEQDRALYMNRRANGWK